MISKHGTKDALHQSNERQKIMDGKDNGGEYYKHKCDCG